MQCVAVVESAPLPWTSIAYDRSEACRVEDSEGSHFSLYTILLCLILYGAWYTTMAVVESPPPRCTSMEQETSESCTVRDGGESQISIKQG